MQKNQISQWLAPLFALLIFQPYCDTDLREISLVNSKQPFKEVFGQQSICDFWRIPKRLSTQDFKKVQCCDLNLGMCVRYII